MFKGVIACRDVLTFGDTTVEIHLQVNTAYL